MRYALFDNSTLTAVQRILGGIVLRNRYAIDSDILALETYIQAILFYDKIIFVDDYKEQYRHNRRSFFNNMLPYTPTEEIYNSLIKESMDFCESIVPRVEAGKLTDGDFQPFFDLLKMNMHFTWDMSGSIFYLTVKLLEPLGGLDVEKYAKISTMIKQELIDKDNSSGENEDKRPILYDSRGKEVVFDNLYADLAPQTKAFFASLNWLAFRTLFYTLVASHLGADLFLHHIRHAFQIHAFNKNNIIDQSIYKPLIETLNNRSFSAVSDIVSPSKPFMIRQDLPMFVAWLANETGDPKDFIKTAYEMRDRDVFIQARQQLIDLESVANDRDQSGYLQKANKIVRNIERQMQFIRSKYSVDTPQGAAMSRSVSLWNLSTLLTKLPQIPDMNENLREFLLLNKIFPPKGFKAVYRDLVYSLTQTSILGEYHDIITSRIKYHPEANFYGPKIEQRKYYGRESDWKKQM